MLLHTMAPAVVAQICAMALGVVVLRRHALTRQLVLVASPRAREGRRK